MASVCSSGTPSSRPASSACLTVCTSRSAAPLLAGWYGEERMCFTPFIRRKASSSSDTNCGPLSDINCSGNPYLAKVSRSLVIVLFAVVLDIVYTSSHLECASVITSSICPLTGPAKSTWIRCHSTVGHAHG